MKALVFLFTICFSANAFAQDAPPKVGNKPLTQVKPREPAGCKLVGTVRGPSCGLVTAKLQTFEVAALRRRKCHPCPCLSGQAEQSRQVKSSDLL
jgi:hypothetical protein